jgi:hypothetical protein
VENAEQYVTVDACGCKAQPVQYFSACFFGQVLKDGSGLMGLVDYASEDDMRRAIRKLDDSEFRNPFDR